MRLLTIGYTLRDPRIDNHTIFNAPPVLDYDAILVDPGRVLTSIREAAEATAEHKTNSGAPVVNGETTDLATGLGELLHRRADEFARALERGAVVALFLYPPAEVRQVSGYSGLDRYFFLPAPPALGWDRTLIRGGEGNVAGVVDHGHAFAPIIDTLHRGLEYRAYFDDRAPGFASSAHVLARSPGGSPVAAEFRVGAGRIVFLPWSRPPTGDRVAALGKAFVDAMDAAHGRAAGEPPSWIAGIEVPGLAGREAAAERAREALDHAQTALDEAEASVADLARVRDVLWAAGDHPLGVAVARCLELLGFEAARGTTPGEDYRVRDGQGDLLVEAWGSDEAVGMEPHYRLRARIEAEIAARRPVARGLVVANGQRLRPPAEREHMIADPLRVAAESLHYAVLPAPALFDAAMAALNGASTPVLASIRSRLLSTDGTVDLADLLAGRQE